MTQTETKAEPSTLVNITRRDFNLVLIGLSIAMLLSALDNTIVSTALPVIVGQFGGLAKFTWVTTAYVVTSSISTLLLGKLSDQIGRRRIFLIAISVFLGGSLLCGIATSMNQLIIFRAVQGFGGGGIWSLAFAVIADFVPPRGRARYFGLFSAVYGFASVAGPLVGGVIVDHTTWRWIFFFNVPLALITLVVTSSVLKQPFVQRPGRFDVTGAVVVSAGIACLMVALEQGPHDGWRSPTVVLLFAAAAASVVAFVAVERRAADPLLPLRMFTNPNLRAVLLLAFVVGTTMMSMGLFYGLFFQDVRFFSPTRAGLAMVPMMGGTMIGATISGRLIAKMGRYRLFPLIGVGASVLGFGLSRTLTVDRPYLVLAFPILLIGLGIGFTMPAITIASQNASDTRDLGIATAASNFFRSVGSSVGLAAFGAVFGSSLASQLNKRLPPSVDRRALVKIVRAPKQIAALDPTIRAAVQQGITHSVTKVFLVAIGLSVVSFAVALLVRELPLRTSADGEAVMAMAD